MARKSKAQQLSEVHAEALKRFNVCQSRESEQRSLAVEDARFCDEHDGQWDEGAKAKRRDRPRYTINRVAPAVDQVVGDQRQNKISIKVRPASGDAEQDIAVISEGVIRNIERQSQAETIYDSAFSEGVKGGYGGWRITTEFADEHTFDQDIRIRPIRSAATSLYFGQSEMYDKRDANHAFYTAFISKDDFETKYPYANLTDFPQNEYSDNDWFTGEEIRIAEYWRKVPVTKRIGLLSDGRTIDLDEEKDVLDELLFSGIEVVRERKVQSHRVEMYIINGVEVLKGPMQWAGKYIPLVPYFGKVSYIEGKEIVKGLVRDAKDANRVYNYATSANIEAAALTPKDPYWLTTRMVGNHKRQFEEFNEKNSPFMLFEPDERLGNEAPKRTGAPSVQQALIGIVNQAAIDVEATTGIHSAALGRAPQLLSEKAVMSQAEKGDRGSFVYRDNLLKSIQYTGDILVDLIPRIYDTERVITILGDDGTQEVLEINQGAFDEFNQPIIDQQTGKQVIVNDLTRGRYDVEVVAGAHYATKKQESLQQLIELAGASEEFASISGDLLAESLDVINVDEIKKRMRKLYIKKGIAEPTEEEIKEMGLDQPQQPDPQAIALIENLNSQTRKNELELQEIQADTQKKIADAKKTLAEAEAQELENDLVESGMIDLLR